MVPLGLALRMAGDQLTSLAWGPLAAHQALTAASTGMLALAVARGWANVPRPVLALLVAWCGCLLLGFLRAEDQGDALRHLGRYLGGPLLLAAALAEGTRAPQLGRALLLASLPALALAWLAWLGGQPGTWVDHGFARLRGGYQNPHNLALTAATAGFWLGGSSLLLGRQPTATRLAQGAAATGWGLALLATWVRTGWIQLGVQLALLGVLRGYGLPVLSLLGASAALSLLHPAVRYRFQDLLHLLSGQAPPGGWSQLGSSRLDIWVQSFSGFLEQGPESWLLGVGLGDHLRLWEKPLDPHLDWLAVTEQLGLVGLAVWLSLWLVPGAQAWRARERPEAAIALALLGGGLLASTLSNALLARPTPAWITWAALATCYSADSAKKS